MSDGDVPVLVADAVEQSPGAGLVALAGWLAETLDGLEGAARAVHGPRVASQLTTVLTALGRPASLKPVDRPPSQLQRLRDARAASDARYGR